MAGAGMVSTTGVKSTAAMSSAGMTATASAAAAPAQASGSAGSKAPSGNGSVGNPAAQGSAGASPSAGSPNAAGSGGAGAQPGAVSTSAAAGSSGVSGGSAGSSGNAAGPAREIPKPMAAPLVWGFGLGITDIPAATKFYKDVMQMDVEKDAVKLNDATETVMYSTKAMRGARVSLVKFDDMRNTRKITTKLVFQAQNPSAVNAAAAMHPDYVSRLNVGIVQFDGPETYVHEVGSIFDDGGSSISVPYPIAVGFAVSDQPASRKFYTSLGMTESSLGSFSVTDVNGTGMIEEYTVKFTDGMGIVLQQWAPMRNAKDNPVKVTLLVPDANAMANKVMAGGGTIVKPAARTDLYDNRLLVVAKDLDGYVLDIVE
jgi:predicted enzyme related to lactoylglutathione lyase